MEGMWNDLLDLMEQVSARRQLFAIAVVLVVAALSALWLQRRTAGDDAFQKQGARRLAFPLIGIGLLAVCRFIAHHKGWPSQLLGLAVQLLVAMAGIRMAVFALRRVFAPSGWLASFEKTLAALIWVAVALDIVGLLPEVIAWLDSFAMPIGKTKVTLWQVAQGMVTILVTVIGAMWLGGIAENRLHDAKTLDANLKVVFSRLVKAVLVLVAILIGMSLAGLDITTLSVFGGALGVGLGFGMQKIAANYVSGFIILLDRSIRLGNIIQLNAEQRGEVTQITTRYTVVRALNGIHYIVPNETLVGTVVQNETFATTRTRVALRVQVGYQCDVEHALYLLLQIASAQPRVLQEPAPSAHLLSFDDSGITLELGVWIDDPLNGTGQLRSDINREIWRRFKDEGLEIPFPQREVRIVGGLPEGVSAETAALAAGAAAGS